MGIDDSLPPLDFLAIGHICRDIVTGGYATGGAAAYTTSVATMLGCRSGIVTSASPETEWAGDLSGIVVHRVDSQATTVFENIYTPTGRIQKIHSVAGKLSAAEVPELWSRTPLVFLGPIANEVDPGLIGLFSNSVVGVGPQGWMRNWDDEGHVFRVMWESAAEVLPLTAVTFMSTEDLPDKSLIDAYTRLSRLLVLTDGSNGCKVYHHDEVRSFPAPVVREVDTTGAGDIFAAAYLVRLYQTDGDYWEAAKFANRIAACSVSVKGLAPKMEAIRHLLDGDHYRASGTMSEVTG